MRDGRDVSEIEELTKIRAKYLRALENEEWALLPGPTFTKGFLRSYAEALGLDARVLIDEYKRQWEEPHELDVAVRPLISGEGRDGGGYGSSTWWRSRWVGAALLVLVLAVALLLIGPGAGKKHHSVPPTGATSVVKKPTITQHKSTSTASTGSCAKSKDGSVPAGCVSLRVVPTAAVYVCLLGDHGGVRIPGVTLDPQSRLVTYHARRFILILGNTSVKLQIDGHLYGVEAGTKPVSYSIDDVHRRRLATPTRLTCP
jgi:hypothetical protein